MIELVIPTLEEMWFRESLMADEETMSYNHAWGGTIPFPKEDWKDWYAQERPVKTGGTKKWHTLPKMLN